MATDFMTQRRYSFEPSEFINSETIGGIGRGGVNNKIMNSGSIGSWRNNNRGNRKSTSASGHSSREASTRSSRTDVTENESTTTTTSLISRRRSMSPLFTPIIGLNSSLTPAILQRNKLDPNFPQTEDEHLYLFHERIIWNQEKSLLPLAHDLADWLNSLLEIPYITPSNLMEKLETGVILCQLAKLIEEKAKSGGTSSNCPKLKGRIRYNAPLGSFFARDNIAMFINFCKDLGVHSNLLFETEDIVSHGEIRSILICLLEVGRLSVKYGVDPPMLVTLEHQIDRELLAGGSGGSGIDSQIGTGTSNTTTDEESQDDETNKENSKHNKINDSSVQVNLLSDSIDSGLHVDDDNPPNASSILNSIRPTELLPKKSDLDIKVGEVARYAGLHCQCVEETRTNFKLRKLSEGKYFINGRTVFVRLLKGVHVMVRVGGGWQTLEEFLVRNDPCRSSRRGSISRNNSCSASASASAASTPTGSVTFRQPFGYTCSNSSRQSMRGLTTPSSSTTLFRGNKGRPVSSPPIMMTKPRDGNFSASSTPVSSRSRHSSRNSIIS